VISNQKQRMKQEKIKEGTIEKIKNEENENGYRRFIYFFIKDKMVFLLPFWECTMKPYKV